MGQRQRLSRKSHTIHFSLNVLLINSTGSAEAGPKRLSKLGLMPIKRISFSRVASALALAWVVAGCSTNAGFGTPATGPNPVNAYPQGVSPGPSGSGALYPGDLGNPAPSGSPLPSPTPVPNTLSIVGAAMRLAYDASAKDPAKAQRLLEFSFALQNTTRNVAKISTVSAQADATALPDTAVSVSAAPNQTSEVAAIALKTPNDPSSYKEILFTFLDNQKKMIGTTKLDVPQPDSTFTSLDQKHPKGTLSIDSAEVSPLGGGQGPHYEYTFALTNASATAMAVTEFDIKPPKGDIARIILPMVIPLRSASSFITMIVPYSGKSLPSGTYTVSVSQNGVVLAHASAVLL